MAVPTLPPPGTDLSSPAMRAYLTALRSAQVSGGVNVSTEGEDVFKQLSEGSLQFRSLASTSSALDIAVNPITDALEFTVEPSQVSHSGLSGLGADDHSQYYNSDRIETWLASKSTTNLAEGTNLYYTDNRVDARIDCLNVKTLGAVGDGVTDDTTAIRNAITAANGSPIFFPPGRYLCSDRLTIPSNTTLYGTNDSTLYFTNSFAAAIRLSGDNITLNRLTIEGPTPTNNYQGGEDGISTSNTIGLFCENIKITSCTILNFGGYGINLHRASNSYIANNHISRIGYTGIALLSADTCVISDNIIDTVSPGSSGNAYGIAITRWSATTSLTDYPTSTNCIVKNNSVYNITIWHAYSMHSGTDIAFVNNYCENCQSGLFITFSPGADDAPKNILAEGNNFKGLNTAAGIVAVAQNSSAPGENIIIKNNTVENFGGTATVNYGAIYGYNINGLIIENNSILSSSKYGIVLDIVCTAVQIVGNYIRDISTQGAVATAIGIMSSTISGIIRNNIYYCQNNVFAAYKIPSPTAGYGLQVKDETYTGVVTTYASGSGANLVATSYYDTTGVTMPVGTTAQRAASPTTGTIRYNSTLSQYEGYASASWQTLLHPDAGSTGQLLSSNGTSLPTWTTPTYPTASDSAGKILRSDGTNNVYSTSTFADTYTASNLLYSNGANTVTGLATANNGVLITSGTGVPSIGSTLPSAVQDTITRTGTISSGTWSSGVNVGNNNIRGTTISTLADDAVTSFTPTSAIGAILIMPRGSTITSIAGIVSYRTSATSFASVITQPGTTIETSTSALTGTTGTDGKVTVSANTDGKIYIENRFGAQISISYVLFGI